MFKLVAKVARDGELLDVMEMAVTMGEGKQMLSAALADARALPNTGQDMENGEVWIDMHDAEADIVSDEPACFHRADAADALQLYFGASSSMVEKCLAKRNVDLHYKDHRAAGRAVLKSVR
ncbi:hypothetical protein [Pandoraea communis]|uniref:hypothetical protein n=1 Tax=Pandoraea communis TaxID=2508297 RepID=UPI0025A6447E|nr:hypothetical protein [Pandoraea communis]MDM8356623.1 hypothetical protein [Pandoraea communis]